MLKIWCPRLAKNAFAIQHLLHHSIVYTFIHYRTIKIDAVIIAFLSSYSIYSTDNILSIGQTLNFFLLSKFFTIICFSFLEKYFLGTQKNFWSDTFPTPDPSLISYPILPPFYRDFLLYFMPVPQISPGSCQLWDTKGRTISVFAISTREGTSLRNLHRNCPSLPSPANVLCLTVIALFILWIKCYICFSLGHPL